MYQLNLLPWREQRRKDRQRQFVGLLGLMVVIGVGAIFLTSIFFMQRIDNQQSRNQFLRNQIGLLNAQIAEISDLELEKTRLLDRKNIIEELQVNRNLMVHLFDQLARTVPDGLQLDKVEQRGQSLTIEGITQSNARVSTYLRSLDRSEWLHNPELVIIEADEGATPDLPFMFRVRTRLASLEEIVQEQLEQGIVEEAGNGP